VIVNNVCLFGLDFDGQSFIGTDHPVGNKAGNNTNNTNNAYTKGKSALSSATLVAAQISFGATHTALRKMKHGKKRPLNIEPDILLVSPALEKTAVTLMNIEQLEDGSPNPYQGAAKVVVSSGLTSDNVWFLLDAAKPVKSLIDEKRKAAVPVAQTDMSHCRVLPHKKNRYGAVARGSAGDGPRLYRSTLV